MVVTAACVRVIGWLGASNSSQLYSRLTLKSYSSYLQQVEII